MIHRAVGLQGRIAGLPSFGAVARDAYLPDERLAQGPPCLFVPLQGLREPWVVRRYHFKLSALPALNAVALEDGPAVLPSDHAVPSQAAWRHDVVAAVGYRVRAPSHLQVALLAAIALQVHAQVEEPLAPALWWLVGHRSARAHDFGAALRRLTMSGKLSLAWAHIHDVVRCPSYMNAALQAYRVSIERSHMARIVQPR